jgi:hypothetical protein
MFRKVLICLVIDIRTGIETDLHRAIGIFALSIIKFRLYPGFGSNPWGGVFQGLSGSFVIHIRIQVAIALHWQEDIHQLRRANVNWNSFLS